MGDSPKAHLFYGFEVDRDGEFREAWDADPDDHDHNAELAKRLEWPTAEWAPEVFDPIYPDDVPPDPEQHKRWLEALRAKNELEESYPVKLHDLSEETGGCWLYINREDAGFHQDWEGFTAIVEPLERSPEVLFLWRELLRKHCELMGIPFKEPGWFLTAYYF